MLTAGLHDTWALGRVLLGESDAPPIRHHGAVAQLWPSRPVRVELRRLAAPQELGEEANSLLNSAPSMTPVASRTSVGQAGARGTPHGRPAKLRKISPPKRGRKMPDLRGFYGDGGN